MYRSIAAVLLFSAAATASEPMNQEQAIALAKETLSREAGIATERVVVRNAQAVDWPDGSLGCPQPGMMYAQMITPGFKVVLAVGDQVYPVHIGAEHAVVCKAPPDGKKVSVGRKKVEAMQRARAALAAKLGVDPGSITAHMMHGLKKTELCKPAPAHGNVASFAVVEYQGKYFRYDAEQDTLTELECES